MSDLDIGIMIEGQNGLNWSRWQRLALAVEHLGFVGLYRSDHYTNANPPDKDSLELWVSLTWLASHTKTLEFGPLVSPVSFRHPTMTARMARDVNDLSGGRLHLGLGAGWQEREHHNFGWDLLEIPDRFVRFEEGLEIITQLLQKDGPVDFEGRFYQLREANLLPRPEVEGGPPIVIGGNGIKRTLPLVARYANEWNAVFLTPEEFRSRNERLDRLLFSEGRDPATVRRSMMVGCIYGKDEAEVEAKVGEKNRTVRELRERSLIVGTPPEIILQLETLANVGVRRVMIQWIDLDDLVGLEHLARSVLPHFQQ